MKIKILLAANIVGVTALSVPVIVAAAGEKNPKEKSVDDNLSEDPTAEKAAIAAVTIDDINDAIKASADFDKNIDANNYMNTKFPKTVELIKNNVHIKVNLTPNGFDSKKGTIKWKAELSSKPHNIVGNKDGTLTGFSTTASKTTKAANDALGNLTVQQIIDAIKAKETVNATDLASVYPFPSTVDVTINHQNITVTLTPGTKDDSAGSIPWTASATVSGTGATPVSKAGSLTGFSTAAARETKTANDALGNLTVQQIIDAIKAKETVNAIDLASTYPFPSTVDVTINHQNITVTLTPGTEDDSAGSIPWTASATVSGTGATPVSKAGSLTGFSTAAARATKAANVALGNLTVQKILDAIKAKETVNATDLASVYPFPRTVDVTINNQNITVTLTPGTEDDSAGSIPWTASATVSGTGATPVSKAGSLTGFSTAAARETKAANDALGNLTVQKILDAIKAKESVIISNRASTYPFPSTVDVTINNQNITVTLTPGTEDDSAGSIPWTASATVSGTGATPVSKAGLLTGFSTTASRATKAANDALGNLTVQQIIDAIKAKETVNAIDLASTYPFPSTVDVTINHQNITVTLTPGTEDDSAGSIPWTASATVSGTGATPVSKAGSLTGFSTAAARATKAANVALGNLTVQKIIDAIKAKETVNATDLASTYPFPSTVDVTINHQNITVTLTPGTENDSAGSIPWTASATVSGTGATPVSKTGTLTGFSTTASRATAKAKNALANITPDMITAAIKKLKPFDNTDNVKTWTLPPGVKVNVNGVDVTVWLSNKKTDAIHGTLNWEGSAEIINENLTPVILKGQLTGFDNDKIKKERVEVHKLMKTIHNSDIQEEFKRQVIFDINNKATTFINQLPPKITFNKADSKGKSYPFTVKLTYSSPDDDKGSIHVRVELISPVEKNYSRIDSFELIGFETKEKRTGTATWIAKQQKAINDFANHIDPSGTKVTLFMDELIKQLPVSTTGAPVDYAKQALGLKFTNLSQGTENITTEIISAVADKSTGEVTLKVLLSTSKGYRKVVTEVVTGLSTTTYNARLSDVNQEFTQTLKLIYPINK